MGQAIGGRAPDPLEFRKEMLAQLASLRPGEKNLESLSSINAKLIPFLQHHTAPLILTMINFDRFYCSKHSVKLAVFCGCRG